MKKQNKFVEKLTLELIEQEKKTKLFKRKARRN